MSNERKRTVDPGFLFIGPDKAGSTWLWKMLAQHPEIYVAEAKDIYFFDKNYSRGWAWYRKYFRGASEKQVAGEFSHDYLYSAVACARIANDLPGVKLLTILRDPVERAFSEYLFLKKHGIVAPNWTIRQAVKKFPHIIEGGMYAKFLQPYLQTFGPNRIFIGQYADIVARPIELLQEICDFLGVESSFKFHGASDRALKAALPRNLLAARLMKKVAVGMRSVGWAGLVGYLKHCKFLNRLLYREYESNDRPTLATEERQWLTDFYRDDQAMLQQLLDSKV